MSQRKRQSWTRENTGTIANRTKIFEQVADIFKDQIDDDVIRLILDQYDWKVEQAIEQLFKIASDDAATKSKRQDIDLAIIACSLLEMDEGSKETDTSQPASLDANVTSAADPASTASGSQASGSQVVNPVASLSSLPPLQAASTVIHGGNRSTSSESGDSNTLPKPAKDEETAFGMQEGATGRSLFDRDLFQFDPSALATSEESIMQMYDEMFKANEQTSSSTASSSSVRQDHLLTANLGATNRMAPAASKSPDRAAPKSLSQSECDDEKSFVVLTNEYSGSVHHDLELDQSGKELDSNSGDAWSVLTDTHTPSSYSSGTVKDKPTPLISPIASNSSDKLSAHTDTAGALRVDRQQDNGSLASISSSFEVIPESGFGSLSGVISSPNTSTSVAKTSQSFTPAPAPTAFSSKVQETAAKRQLNQNQVGVDSVDSSTKTNTSFLQAADMGLSAEAPEFVPTFPSPSPASIQTPYFYSPMLAAGTPIPTSYSMLRGSRGGLPSFPSQFPSPRSGLKGAPVRNIAVGNLIGANLYQAPTSSVAPTVDSVSTKVASPVLKTPAESENVGSSNRGLSPNNVNSVGVSACIQTVKSYTDRGTKLLVILRGLPGSGKTHLARAIKGRGEVFSTDDFFMRSGRYEYNPEDLTEAHTWNKCRVRDALEQGVTPVIVDNTNVMMWEMLPYAQMADDRGYSVEVMEPDTPWKFQPKRLAKCNSHGVPLESIKRMKDRYQTVDTDMLRAQLSKRTSGSGKAQARPEPSPSPKQLKGNGPGTASSKQSIQDKSSQGTGNVQEKNSGAAQKETGGNRPSAPSVTTPVKSAGSGKKKSKKQKTQTLAVWEYIAGLIEEGATDDEVEAFIYMAKLTDSEREEINKWKENFKAGGTMFNEEKPNYSNSLGTTASGDKIKGGSSPPQTSLTKNKSKSGAFPNVISGTATSMSGKSKTDADSSNSIENPESTQWEEPKPQRKARKLQSSPAKQQQFGKGSVSLTQESSLKLDQQPEIEEPEVSLTWEEPKPQRRERGPRTSRGSSSDTMDSPRTEDVTTVSVESRTRNVSVSEESHNNSTSTESTEGVVDDNSDVIIEQETVEILSFVVLSSGSDTDVSKDAALGVSDISNINPDLRIRLETTEVEKDTGRTEENVSEETDIGGEHQSNIAESLSSIVMVGYSSSSEDDAAASSALPASSVTQKEESDISRSSVSPEKQRLSNSAAENSESSVPSTSPRKKVRRKKHKVPPKPFLEDSIRDHLSTESWKRLSPTMQITDPRAVSADGSEESSEASADEKAERTPGREASSQTEVQDFNIAFMVETSSPNHAVPIENSYQYIVARGHYSSADSSASVATTVHSSSIKHKIDASTMIDTALEHVEPDMEILQNCFPEVAAGHLKEVLEVCAGNMEWATNLLLDWGVSTPFTPQDKHQLRQEMAKHQEDFTAASFTAAAEDSVAKSQPPSLFDLCQKLLSQLKGTKQVRDDVQRHLISSGYQRLQRIESHELERLRSISLDEGRADGSTSHLADDIISLTSFSAISSATEGSLERSPGKKKGSSLGSPEKGPYQLKDVIEEVFPSEISPDLSKTGSLSDKSATSGAAVQSHVVGQQKKTVKSSSPLPQVSEAAAPKDLAAGSEDASGLMLTLPKSFIDQLEQLFGPLPQQYAAGSDVSVNLDYTTAYHLHECLSHSPSSSQSLEDQERERLRQLKEDEALAQWLQAEEEVERTLEGVTPPNAAVSPTPVRRAVSHKPQLPSHKRVAVGGISIRDRSRGGARQRPLPRPSVNLEDIMAEEMARQQRQELHLKQLEATGNHIAIATKLKREKLYQHFPGIDENFLEEIFQANGFCLETTVSVIESALGDKQPVPHRLVISTPSSSATTDTEPDEERRVEAAKQQSLLDMLGTAWQGERDEKYQRVDVADGTEFDYQELRQEALVHHRMRGDCFKKAHEAFRRGMREVALFYSQQGHLHTQRMQEANMRASQKILEAREARLNEEATLDLHGLHVDEAIAALKRVLDERDKEFQQKPVHNRRYMYVVTGRGRHSQNGVARIRPAVIAHLTSTGHRFSEVHAGMLKVSLHHTPS